MLKKITKIANNMKYKTILLPESKKILRDFSLLYYEVAKNFICNHQNRREIANKFFLAHSGELEKIESIKDFYINNVEDNFPIPVRLYKINKDEKIILFIHGGGWVQGNIETHDYLCRKLAKTLNINVLAIDYRLAPENKFPVPFYDVVSVYLWCCRYYKKIYLSGDSAGGNLCAALSIEIFDKKLCPSEGMILFYPVLGNNFCTESYILFSHLLSLSQVHMMYFFSQYSGQVCNLITTVNNKYISPLLEKNIEVFPKTVIVSAGCDVLLTEQIEFVKKMKREEKDCEHIILDGAIHGFMTYGKEFNRYNDDILKNILSYLS